MTKQKISSALLKGIFGSVFIGIVGIGIYRSSLNISEQTSPEAVEKIEEHADASANPPTQSADNLALTKKSAPPEKSPIQEALPSLKDAPQPSSSSNRHLEIFLEKIKKYSASPNPFADKNWAELEPLFFDEISSDPHALATVIESLIEDPISTQGQMLSILLGRSDSPGISNAAVDLTTHKDVFYRQAGLQLIGRLGMKNDSQQEAVLSILEGETNQEILKDAFAAALPRSEVLDTEQKQRVVEVALKYSREGDQRLRLRAIETIGRWATKAIDFQPVAESLGHEVPLIRREAARAFVRHPEYASQATKVVLLEILADDNEKKTVKRQSKKALLRMKLSLEQQKMLEKFKNN